MLLLYAYCVGIVSSRKEMEAETAAAAARQCQEEAEQATAKAMAAREAAAPAAEQAAPNRKAEAATVKAKAARKKAIEAAENAGIDPPDLERLASVAGGFRAVFAMPWRGLARRADGTPIKATQLNHRCAEGFAYTGPDSHLMKTDGHFIQGYNGKLAVVLDHQVIVAIGVSNQPPDFEHREPMLERIATTTDALPDVMTMDAGYWTEDNAKACVDQGIDAFIATGHLPHGKPPPPKRGPMPKDADAKARLARKIRSKKRSRIYAQW